MLKANSNINPNIDLCNPLPVPFRMCILHRDTLPKSPNWCRREVVCKDMADSKKEIKPRLMLCESATRYRTNKQNTKKIVICMYNIHTMSCAKVRTLILKLYIYVVYTLRTILHTHIRICLHRAIDSSLFSVVISSLCLATMCEQIL